MPIPSLDQILAATPPRAVPVPEWGEGAVLYVRRMTARQVVGMSADLTGTHEDRSAAVLAATVCDEAGSPLWTRDDAARVLDAAAEPVLRLLKAANDLNDLGDESGKG